MSLWSGVSVKLCSQLKVSLVCISDPFWYFNSMVYSLSLSKSVLSLVVGDLVLLYNSMVYSPSLSKSVLSLVVGDLVLLLIICSIALWSTSTSKYLLHNNCIKAWMFTNKPVNSNSVTPKFFTDLGSLLE